MICVLIWFKYWFYVILFCILGDIVIYFLFGVKSFDFIIYVFSGVVIFSNVFNYELCFFYLFIVMVFDGNGYGNGSVIFILLIVIVIN